VAALLASPATVILVDDVVTTGATAAACVEVLRAGGLRVDGVLTVTAA
jgi:predicted amidophosphoribosyltransferase